MVRIICIIFCSMLITYGGDNLLFNGGFEIIHSAAVPDGWGIGRWGLQKAEWRDHEQDFRCAFRTDQETVFEGRRSLLIDNRFAGASLAAYSCYVNPAIFIKGIKYWTFSAYAFAPTGGKIALEILELKHHHPIARKIFQVQPQKWLRLSISEKLSEDTVILRISPQQQGRFFLDAAQFEANKLTEYKQSIYDILRAPKTVYGKAYDFIEDSKLKFNHGMSSVRLEYRNRTFYQNKRPFIPYLFGDNSTPDLTFYQELWQSGFNGICLNYKENNKRGIDLASQAGLYVLPWMWPKNLAEQEQMMKAIVNNPAVIAWKVIDEPADPFAEIVLKRVASARRVDPARPIMVNYRTSEIRKYLEKLSTLPGDIISSDEYPVGNFLYPGGVLNSANLIAEMEQHLYKSPKAIWNWFQLTGNAFMNTREPTPAEYELMLYGALIKGCRGFITFQNKPLSQDLWRTAIRIGKEFQVLAPVIYGSKISPPAGLPKEILTMARIYHNEIYLICVNSSERKIAVQFQDVENIEAVFEHRRLNKSTDVFLPYQRHIYRYR